MSKKALEHVDSRDLAEEQLWRSEAETESVAGDEPVDIVVKRPPARKDTKTWCKGKVGRQHTLAIEVPPNAYRGCRWYDFIHREPWYSCQHVELCTQCGKVLRRSYGWLSDADLKPEDCPDYRPYESAPAANG